MLLELTGRLDPGELWARIDVPENVLPPRGFGLELLDLVACADGDHADDHFEAHPVSEYPPRRVPYEENVVVRVPRPQPAVHRRRTIYLAPELEAPGGGGLARYPRQAPAQPLPPEPHECRIQASYSLRRVDFPVPGFDRLSVSRLFQKLNSTFKEKVLDHFHHALPEWTDKLVQFVPDRPDARQTGGRCVVTLPPLLSLSCDSYRLWTVLGVEPADVQQVHGGSQFMLVNDGRQARTVEGKRMVTQNVLATFAKHFAEYDAREPAPDLVTFAVTFSLGALQTTVAFDPDTFLPAQPDFPAFFFTFLADTLEGVFCLRKKSLDVVFDGDRGVVTLARNAALPQSTHTGLAGSNHLWVLLQFGDRLWRDLSLRLPEYRLRWAVPGHSDVLLRRFSLREKEEAARVPPGELEAKLAWLQEDFLNQKTRNLYLRERAKKWPAVQEARRVEKVQAVGNTTLTAAAAAETEAEKKKPAAEPPPPDVEEEEEVADPFARRPKLAADGPPVAGGAAVAVAAAAAPAEEEDPFARRPKLAPDAPAVVATPRAKKRPAGGPLDDDDDDDDDALPDPAGDGAGVKRPAEEDDPFKKRPKVGQEKRPAEEEEDPFLKRPKLARDDDDAAAAAGRRDGAGAAGDGGP